jgi:hypothetical protein
VFSIEEQLFVYSTVYARLGNIDNASISHRKSDGWRNKVISPII